MQLKLLFTPEWICSYPDYYAGQSFEYIVGFFTSNSDNNKSFIEVEMLPDNRGYEVLIAFVLN
jgi:hypothetical protein